MRPRTRRPTIQVINKFKLRENVRNYNLAGMGCSASVVAVDLAKDLLHVHPNSVAVVISTENITQNWYQSNDQVCAHAVRACPLPAARSQVLTWSRNGRALGRRGAGVGYDRIELPLPPRRRRDAAVQQAQRRGTGQVRPAAHCARAQGTRAEWVGVIDRAMEGRSA